MTQVGILFALEKSKLTLEEVMKVTHTGKSSSLKQANILRKRGQIIRLLQGTADKGNIFHYEITDKGRERLKKLKELNKK